MSELKLLFSVLTYVTILGISIFYLQTFRFTINLLKDDLWIIGSLSGFLLGFLVFKMWKAKRKPQIHSEIYDALFKYGSLIIFTLTLTLTAVYSNTHFDTSRPESVEGVIIAASSTYNSKGHRSRFAIFRIPVNGQVQDVKVSLSEEESLLDVGDKRMFKLHQGYFGYRWLKR